MKQKNRVEILINPHLFTVVIYHRVYLLEQDFLSASQKRQYSLFDGILVSEHDGLVQF